MEKGAKAIVWLLASALLLGVILLGIHPLYRETVGAWWRGARDEAPIWRSNERYYEAIELESQSGASADER